MTVPYAEAFETYELMTVPYAFPYAFPLCIPWISYKSYQRPCVIPCADVDPAFTQLREAAEALTPFATVFRYPGDVLEPEPSDVEEGMSLAESVLEFVLARVPDEVKR